MFQPRVMRIFKHIENSLRAKFKRLKVLFESVGRTYVRSFIAVQNFKKFD